MRFSGPSNRQDAPAPRPQASVKTESINTSNPAIPVSIRPTAPLPLPTACVDVNLVGEFAPADTPQGRANAKRDPINQPRWPVILDQVSVGEVMRRENEINRTGKNAGNQHGSEYTLDTFVYGHRASGFYLVDVPISLLNHQHDPDAPDFVEPHPDTNARIDGYATLDSDPPPILITYAPRGGPTRHNRTRAFVANGNHRVEASRRAGRESIEAFIPIEDYDFWISTVLPNIVLKNRIHVTETAEFKAWFAGSKVVDAAGRPLRCYHGTGSTKITEFLPEGGDPESGEKVLALFRKARENNEPFGYLNFRSGTFFSPHPEYAGNYTAENTGVMFLVFIKAVNPVRYDQRTHKVTLDDPMKTPDVLFMVDGDAINEIAVIDPTQVKSAIGNCGYFDPNNPDIRA